MEVGQEFIPYRMFTGAFLPEALMRYTGVSASAKLVWARLARYAGERGLAYPSQSTLAGDCGISLRCCKECLKALETLGFIVRKGMVRQNVAWGFLLHPCLQPVHNLHQAQAQENTQPVRNLHSEAVEAESAPGKCANCTPPVQNLHSTGAESAYKESHEESHGRESSSLITSVKSTSQRSDNCRSPDDEEEVKDPLVEFFTLLFIAHGARPDFGDYESLRDLIEDYGRDDVIKALKAARDGGARGRRVLPYARKCLKDWRSNDGRSGVTGTGYREVWE